MALKRIAFGVATLSAARIFQLASSFVAIPFLARMLTPVDFGLAALALSMVMFFTMIGDAGLGRSLVRVDAQRYRSLVERLLGQRVADAGAFWNLLSALVARCDVLQRAAPRADHDGAFARAILDGHCGNPGGVATAERKIPVARRR